jgi:RNA polymerase sigma-70 factor (ECF subfamily)
VPLVLFHFDNISYQAIADLLGVSLGKVKTDIHRGREALKKHLTTSHVSG